jgi:ABC-type glycerol-3-phosphate transport system substrate-binding protein
MKRVLAVLLAAVLTMPAVARGRQDAGSPQSSVLQGEIRFSWWGSEVRNNATIEAIKLYESQHPGVKIVPEYSAFDGYNNKLMAQLAAKNAPDIFTMNPEWLPAVVDAGGLTDLTGLIDISAHNPQVAAACAIGGKIYGINVSLNANVIIYNKTLADEFGIKMPTGDYTWADLASIFQQVYQKSGGKTYGMPDHRMKGGLETFYTAWAMTYLGKEPPYPWTDTEILVTADDIAVFEAYFGNLPQGVVLPPEESALLGGANDQHLTERRTFASFEYAGTFGQFQSQTKDELAMIQYPNDKKGNAVSARPGLVEGVFSGSKNKALAVDFLAWFANSPDAARILKTSRGVLPSSTQLEAVIADPSLLSAQDQKIFAIINQVFAKPVNPYSPGPPGVITSLFNDTHMRLTGQEVGFGRITPAEAGKRFLEYKDELMDNY